MKTKKIIKKVNYLSIEYKKLEKYLETMATKGWILESAKNHKTSSLEIVFYKSLPCKLRYCHTVSDSYPEAANHNGWQYVCDINSLHIFKSDQQNIEPLQSEQLIEDELITAKIYRQDILKLIRLALLNTLLTFIYGWLIAAAKITSFIQLAGAIIIMSFMIGCLIYSFGVIIYTHYCYTKKFYHQAYKPPLVKSNFIYPYTFIWLLNLVFIFAFNINSEAEFNDLILILLCSLVFIIGVILVLLLKKRLDD